MENEQKQLDTPVLFLIFNRPEVTEKVFKQIRKVRPRKFFIAADGPRITHPEDITKCSDTRKLVLAMIDWDCEVETLFREENLGCGLAVSQAITWFFEHVEMGIILEDDIFTTNSFYLFSSEMLKRYNNDNKILFISGSNFQLGKKRGDGDYYYSKFPNTWGWATWKEEWDLFNYNLATDEKIKRLLIDKIPRKDNKRLWQRRLQEVENKRQNIWDYQWFTNIFFYDKLSIVPNKNLVKNLGIGLEEATNTYGFSSNYKKIKIEEFTPPYKFPTNSHYNYKADLYHFRKFFKSKPSFINRIRNVSYMLIPERIYVKIKALFGR